MPDLVFSVEGAEAPEHTATPMVACKLRIENRGGDRVRSIMLGVQVRIAAEQRAYTDGEQDRLVHLFGEPRRWADTLRGLLWTQSTVLVPAFSDAIVVDLPIACTYDFEVASAQYLDALADGEIPIELLFSGTVFAESSNGLQATRIPWDREATYRLPVAIWRAAMERHFPNSAWLRLRKDTFDRLYDYRNRLGLPTWEAALDRLLAESEAHL